MYCSTLRGADWVEQYNSTVLSTALLLYCSTALLVERGADWVEQYNMVFERYVLFFTTETAPPRPLGPKGEVYFVSAGKI